MNTTVTNEHREHMTTVPTPDLTRWLSEGMYRPGSPLHTAAMDELHGRALTYDDNRFARGLSSC